MSTRRTATEIRQQFIDYFVKKCGHAFVPSSPCVPLDDPTLMFTNAGMNQFKPIFLGTEKPSHLRIANTQKCIRAGGKHNDLDDVGHDTYHHTFFEMLGNWSFGDYFKKEAIAWAWDLLTNVWGVDKARLHATYFRGDAAEGLEPDSEAAELWRTVTDIDPTHIHPGNKKDNFWEMGDTGPCGPCSEIHIDLTPDKSGVKLVNAGDARVMEIWNLVFIQFNRGGDGKLTPLPAKHVDTGMGFERLTSILQGKKSNYDTDVFTPIFAAIQRVTGARPYTGLLEDKNCQLTIDNSQLMSDVAYRVIADHLRCLTFAITDGAMPSNDGRGYVLRRILRRAVRYGRQYLGTREPFICNLVTSVVEAMGDAFPELTKNPQRVAGIIRDEEASFIKTLDRGIALFEEAATYAVQHHHGRISGEDAFKLHDTYGFPIDLTELMADERGLSVNIGEYERLMEDAREKSRAKIASIVTGLPEEAFLNPTEDRFKYDDPTKELKAKYLRCAALSGGDRGFIFDQTPFYAKQGGQVGDRGELRFSKGTLRVRNTTRERNQILHEVDVGELENLKENLKEGETASLQVDLAFRAATMKNHTATHVMNWALREVLGEHVQQKGSEVDPDKTRFDLSHHAQIADEELARIERLTNEQIKKDLPVHTNDNEPVDQKAAMKINGLRAVFGEKYPDQVRVVSIGVPVADLLKNPDNPDWRKYSVEFCGGTHVKSTGEIGHFRLIEESAVAKGIRRVVGVTGERAERAEADAAAVARLLKEAAHVADAALSERIAEIQALMNQTEFPVVERNRFRVDLAHLQERLKAVAKQQAKAGAADLLAKADQLLADAQRVGGVAIITADMGTATVDQLRSACDSLRNRAGSAAILLAGENDGKVVLLAAMTPDVVAKGVKAGDLIKEIAPIVGGKGGGKPDLAQGGGADVSKVPEAVATAQNWLRGKLA